MTARTKAILLIVSLVVIVYSNSLGGMFLSDDNYFVVKNVAIRSLSNIPSFFTNPATVAFAALAEDVYRPVTATSYTIDYFLFFLDSFGYHLENVLFHAANAALVYLLVYLLAADAFIALVAAVFFATHPVQTEVVSWISGRASVLFLLFYLGAFLCYARARRQPGAADSRRYLAYSSGFYLLSLFSKEMAVTLPVMLIAYDIHFPSPAPDGWRKRCARYLPYLLLTAFFIAVRAAVLSRMSQCGWWGGTPYANLLSAVAVLPEYLKVLLNPAELCAFYMPQVARSFAETRVLAAVAMLALAAAAMPLLFKRSRPASFAVVWFFVTLLPVSNLVPLRALIAERFLYIPSIGFCLLLALALGAAYRARWRYGRAVAAGLAIGITLVYSVRTMIRNEDWADPIRLSQSIIRVQPLNSWGYTSLGTSYIGEERYREAILALRKAIAITRDYSAPRAALGFCHLQLGEYDRAVTALEETLAIEPRNLEAIVTLGVAYANLKRHDDAIRVFTDAIRIDPTFVSAYLNLGTAYEQTGQNGKAMEAYRTILDRTNSLQDIGIAHIRMGDLRLRMGDEAAARAHYQTTIDLCAARFAELKTIAEERLGWLGGGPLFSEKKADR